MAPHRRRPSTDAFGEQVVPGAADAFDWRLDEPFRCGLGDVDDAVPAVVCVDGVEYPTVEHAYQAAKTTDGVARERIRRAVTPGDAKSAGGSVTLRSDWDDVKVDVMRDLLVQKFSDRRLWDWLLETAPLELVEGNTWGDTFWGVCNGEGQNMLGRLLMDIRDGTAPPATFD